MDRMEKINQLVKREVSDIIQFEMQDPRLEFVTVTEVSVSRDLRHARISVSVLGDASKAESALDVLNKARNFIRRSIAQRVTLRYIPEVDFIYDKSIEYSSSIEQKIAEIKNETEQNQ